MALDFIYPKNIKKIILEWIKTFNAIPNKSSIFDKTTLLELKEIIATCNKINSDLILENYDVFILKNHCKALKHSTIKSIKTEAKILEQYLDSLNKEN